MGAVYRAEDGLSGQLVALKVLKVSEPEALARFSREAQLLTEVSHPNIVGYVAHGKTEDDEPFLAMEWIDGEDLSKRLRRGPLTPEDTVRLGVAVAEALGAAHKRGIVHRDLKPGNLLLADCDPGRPRLVDFGIARLSSTDRGLTATGVVVGTPGYLAPEQARGERDVDARADVFSLGCVLFRCLTGRLPFTADDPVATLLKVVLEEAPRVRDIAPHVSAELDEVVATLLAKPRDGRPSNGAEAATLLAAVSFAGEGGEERSSRPSMSLGGSERRSLCLLLARPTPTLGEASDLSILGAEDLDSMAATRRVDGNAADPLRRLVGSHGGRFDTLADGSVLATFSGGRAPSDDARAAAHAALGLFRFLPNASMALVPGRGVVSGALALGSVIEQAVSLAARGVGIHISEDARETLSPLFEIDPDGVLRGRRGDPEVGEGQRTLLGRPTPCVGRERELAVLQGFIEECAADSVARAVTVVAGAGMGKSRLRHEITSILTRRAEPVTLWVGRGDPASMASPFGVVAQALRRAAAVIEGEPLPVQRGKLDAWVGRSLRGVDGARAAAFLGEILSIPAERPAFELLAARRDPTLLLDHVRRAFEDLVVAEQKAAPLVFVLEDMHWCDRPSIDLLDATLAAQPGAALLVLGFARPEVHENLPKLFRDRDHHEVRLGPLSPRAAEKLARKVLADDASDDKVSRVVELSGGNAFFLEELLRAVAEGRDDELPDSVLSMVEARLASLEPPARRVLRAASVFGQVFWRGGVEALVGNLEVRDWLDVLVSMEIVAKRPKPTFVGEDEYAFRHVLVRDAAYAMLTGEDRTLGHRLAGVWLEQKGEPEAALLAAHFQKGEDPARALVQYQRAATKALAGNDFAAVLAHVAAGVACAEAVGEGASAEEGALRLLGAEAHRWRAELSVAEQEGNRALQRLPRGSALFFKALTEVIVGAARRVDREALGSHADQVLTIEAEGEGQVLRMVAGARAVVALVHAGDYARVDRLLDWLDEAMKRPAVDPIAEAWVHRARATSALRAGDPGAYVDCLRLAADAFERAGDARNASNQRSNLGFGYTEIGAFDDAAVVLRATIASAVRMRLPYVELLAKHNLGLALARLGHLDEACQLESEAADKLTSQGYPLLGAISRVYLALALILGGNYAAAEKEVLVAEGLLSDKPAAAYAAAIHAESLLGQGRFAEALAQAERGMQIVSSHGGTVDEGESIVRLAHARALQAAGDVEGARAAIRAASDRLYERASGIRDDDVRRSFLERVPENAATLAMAREVG